MAWSNPLFSNQMRYVENTLNHNIIIYTDNIYKAQTKISIGVRVLSPVAGLSTDDFIATLTDSGCLNPTSASQ